MFAIMDVRIESLNPTLAPWFDTLNREWIEGLFKIEPPDEEFLAHPERLVEAGGAVLFATWDGEPVGTGALIRLNDDTAEIVKMAVRSGQQGRGIGAKLLQALLDVARERGFREVRIETSSRLPAANTLYQKFGFTEEVGAKSHHGFSRSDIFYSLQLDS